MVPAEAGGSANKPHGSSEWVEGAARLAVRSRNKVGGTGVQVKGAGDVQPWGAWLQKVTDTAMDTDEPQWETLGPA